MMKFQERFCFILTLFIVGYKYTLAQSFADNDLWHRLAVGKIFSQLGTVIHHDIFSYAPTKPVWIDHEWGSGVIFYYISHYLGDYGLLSLKFLVLSTVVWLIYSANTFISGDKKDLRIGFYAVSLMAIILGFGTTARCMIFTYLFFALWIYLLEKIRRGENRFIWIFPLTMCLWANLHAGFLSGIGLLVLYALGEFLNKKDFTKYIKILLITIPATFITPYSIAEFWKYIISAATMPRPNVIEWMPLNLFGNPAELSAFKILLVMTISGYIYKYVKKDNKTDFVAALVLAVTLFLALSHLRHQVFFALAASIFSQHRYFYQLLKDAYLKILNKPKIADKDNKFSLLKILFIDAVLVLFCLYYTILFPPAIKAEEPQYPVRAVEFIKLNNLKGNLLTTFNWGSYALWKLYPQCLIFEDGRYEEVYYNKSNADMDNFVLNTKNWHDIMRKYHHDIILVNSNIAVLGKIKQLKEWRIVYEDNCSTILVPTGLEKTKWLLPAKTSTIDNNKYLNSINF